jgi:NRPS condensation-like uncharacterized protein
MDRVAPVNFVVVADVAGPLTAARLEAAVDGLSRRHPLLRARVSEEGSRLGRVVLFRAGDVPRPEVRRIGDDLWTPEGLVREIEAELARPFDVATGPLFRVAVSTRAGARSRLLLTMHHMVADGASATIALADLLGLASGEPAGDVTLPLVASGPVFEGVGRARALWDLAGFGLRAARHLLLRLPSGRTVPGLNAPAAGRETGVLLNDLDARHTSAIRAAAKAEATTVGGLLTAAIARSVHAASHARDPAHVSVVNAVDVREAMDASARARVDLLMSFVVTHHEIGDRRTFFEVARECSTEVRRAIARRDPVIPHTLASLLPSIEPGEAVRATIRVADRFATSAAVTNVGPLGLPATYGELTLEAVRFAPSLGFMGHFSGVASTFAGRLSWNFSYVKQVVGHDLATELADRAIDDLLTHVEPWVDRS